MVVMGAVFVALSFGQATVSGLLTPPTPVSFDVWRLREDSEFWRSYDLRMPTGRPSGIERNDTFLTRIWMPTDQTERVPVVILLHFWGATDLGLERQMGEELAKRGVATVAVTLTYHMERAPAGSRSGELAVTADPAQLRETMAQSVADVRRVIQWIEVQDDLDSERIGVGGTSLGALVASLSFAVDPRLKSGCFLLGGADLAQVFFRSSRTAELRVQMRANGIDEERLRAELVEVEPLTYLKAEDRPSFVIRARFDTVIPPETTDELVARLATAQSLTLESGHFGGALVQGPLIRTVAQFFVDSLTGRSFRAPDRFFTPTLRIGLTAGGAEPLSVFGSLDVWRSRGEGGGLGLLMVTPQGPRLFLGGRLGRDGGVGIVVSPRKTTWGLMWGQVL